MKRNSVFISSKEARNMLSVAFDNAAKVARKNCDDYIKYNPQDAERRRRNLDIELCGINNLYYRMVDELERAEKTGRSANF